MGAVNAEPKKRLGRGLDALLGAYPAPASAPAERAPAAMGAAPSGGPRTLPIDLIDRNPRNPRRAFRDEDLAELTDSLKAHGIVQPIVVRAGEGGRYEIVAGERRWRAAQRAGLHDVPVAIVDVGDREALELAIVENVQRADLNPLEEARGYEALIEEFKYTQANLAETIGKSRVHVTNMLRLLKLPASVLALVEAGTLSAGHARALLGAADPAALARVVAEKHLSVRETERLAQSPDAAPRGPSKRSKAEKSADVRALEHELMAALGMTVRLGDEGYGKGTLTLYYRSLEQLDGLVRRLKRPG